MERASNVLYFKYFSGPYDHPVSAVFYKLIPYIFVLSAAVII
jgi:hypothetical protein